MSPSVPLAAFYREVNRFRYRSTDTIDVRPGRQTVDHDPLSVRHGDHVAVFVQQFEHDGLIAMILVDLRIQV